MSRLQYEFMLGIQKSRFDERLRRRPFLKILPGTENAPVPILFDPRTEQEVITCINHRMKHKIYKQIK